jgi:cell division protein FtsB
LSNLQIILIALIIVGGRLAIDFSQRIIEGQQKISDQQDLEAEIQQLQDDEQQLEAEKAYYSSPSFIETWAHDEGKMVRDGERLIVPIYEDVPSTAQQAVSLDQASKASTSWEIWWTLFFDSPPPFAISPGS